MKVIPESRPVLCLGNTRPKPSWARRQLRSYSMFSLKVKIESNQVWPQDLLSLNAITEQRLLVPEGNHRSKV